MTDCKKLKVDKKTCSIIFGEGKQVTTIDNFKTCRNEMMLIHLNPNNKVIEIELVSNDKPCQKPDRKK